MTDNLSRDLSSITMIVIHCADTPNGLSRYTIKDIDRWHSKPPLSLRRMKWALSTDGASGYQYCGYHFVIHTDGSIHKGRELNEVGAHATPYNSQSIGVCMIGTDRFTAGQWMALESLVRDLKSAMPNIKQIVGHRDLVYRKICPGFDVAHWYYNCNMEPLERHTCTERKR